MRLGDIAPSDIDDLVRLVLALCEQQGDPVDQFDRAIAERDFLGNPPFVSGLLARAGTTAAGFIAWHPSYEAAYAARGAYVTALWVEPEFRRQGIATAMIAAAAKRVAATGGDYLWWASKPWNVGAHDTYQALGAGSELVHAHALFGEAFLAAARHQTEGP